MWLGIGAEYYVRLRKGVEYERQIVGYSTTPWSPKNMTIAGYGCRLHGAGSRLVYCLGRISGKQDVASIIRGTKFLI